MLLPLYPCYSLINVRQDCPLQKILPLPAPDNPSEYTLVECLRNGFSLLFRVIDSIQRSEEILARIDHFHFNTQFLEKSDHLFALTRSHQPVFDKDRLQPLAQSSM